MTEDPSYALASHVCRTGFADLPASTIESARRDILDTFGCMLGGSGSPGIDELCSVIGHWGGRAESRVLLRGMQLPAPQAALLNASMGHALDFDDTLDTGGSIHPGVSVLGSVLAAADMLGGVTGKDMLLAVALGLDVSCRIAFASTVDRGWHRTAMIGVFGATAAVGKLMARLDLTTLISTRVLSAEMGFLKPDLRAFRTVQARLGLFPGEIAMVGDSWRDDISGALEAGWTAIWVNRSGKPRPPHDPEADLVESEFGSCIHEARILDQRNGIIQEKLHHSAILIPVFSCSKSGSER